MDDEFDDELDEICSQVQMLPSNEISTKKENVFKVPDQPKYTFNRVQTKLGPSFFGSQQSNVFVQQQNRQNVNSKNQFKVNQPPAAPKNPTSTFSNQFKNNQFKNNQFNSNQSTSNQANSNQFNQNRNINQQSKPNSGNVVSNLTKSIAALNKDSLYSVNKHVQGHSKSTVTSNQGNKTFQKTVPKELSSQLTVASTSSSLSQVNRSSFNISNNVSAEVSINSLKTLNNYAVDPSDKFLGKIQILESEKKKKEDEIQKLKRENEELKERNKKEKENYEKEIDAIKTHQYFDESARISRQFQETVLNSQIDRTLPILDRTLSSTTYHLKKQSPKKQSPKKQSPKKNHQQQSQSIIQIPKFEPVDTSLFESQDDFIIPETQFTQSQPVNNQMELELTTIPPTQFDDNTAHFAISDYRETIGSSQKENNLIDSYEDDDYVPPTQFMPEPSVKVNSTIDRKSKSKSKRIKTEQPELFQDEAVLHEARFKFIDFQIYDNLHEENRINFLRENVNPIFDQIIEEIINLDLNKEDLSGFELKFSKLNERFILFLIYIDFKLSIIPELTFNLLANLNEYTNKLDDKKLLYKLSSKCFFADNDILSNETYKNYKNDQTLFNRMLDIFSSCRSISKADTQNYLRFCYSIILFFIENTVEDNQIGEFHSFKCKPKCWLELQDTIGQFALFMIDIFDKKNDLHHLIAKDLVKFVIVLYRTKATKGVSNSERFPRFALKLAAKIDFDYLRHLKILS